MLIMIVTMYLVTRYAAVKVRGGRSRGALAAGCWEMGRALGLSLERR